MVSDTQKPKIWHSMAIWDKLFGDMGVERKGALRTEVLEEGNPAEKFVDGVIWKSAYH